MSETRGLLLAAFLSALTVVLWQYFFYVPVKSQQRIVHGKAEQRVTENINNSPVEVTSSLDRESILLSNQNDRIKIKTHNLHGSIVLKGAKFDDITLAQYHTSNAADSPEVVLLSPAQSSKSYFAEFGWVSLDSNIKIPDGNTVWTVDKNELLENEEVVLKWDNGEGILFKIIINVDDKYLFSINQYVVNSTNHPVRLIPYGRLNRSFLINKDSSFIFHEGPIRAFDDKFEELSYDKLRKKKLSYTFNNGWFGFADKYWFAAIVPFSNKPMNSHMKLINNKYQLDFTHTELVVDPNTAASTASYLFTGAKNINVLDSYSKRLNIKFLDRVVDFGILYFITKPIFLLLQYLNSWIGNFGVAILLLTVLVRIAILPLSIKATVSMLKMRKIKPELQRIKQLNAHDKIKMNQEVMSLFKKNNVTPMAGLVPSILQIPIFFSLYKVLSITIEMRQAPFFLWIKDLSVKDPTNIFTVFGYIDWNPPSILSIGVLPLMLGLTMLIQQKITSNYQSNDSAHADAVKFMPYIFTFLFASFPAGLVLYWVWNNFLSIMQQIIITKLRFKD